MISIESDFLRFVVILGPRWQIKARTFRHGKGAFADKSKTKRVNIEGMKKSVIGQTYGQETYVLRETDSRLSRSTTRPLTSDGAMTLRKHRSLPSLMFALGYETPYGRCVRG